MIKVKNLNKSFGSQQILFNINLEVQDGEILFILGESGSGKSVLLQHLIGLLKPESGSVEIDGKDITRLTERELLKVRKNIGYLFQEGALYDFMTVGENVAFPLEEHAGIKPKEIKNRVAEILKSVGLSEAINKYPAELSGGMKKRSALARSVVLGTKILFCDEPTSGLDPIKSRQITDLISDIVRKLHCTTVIASHDIHNAFRIADRVILIRDGKIVAQGKPKEIQASKDAFVKEFLS